MAVLAILRLFGAILSGDALTDDTAFLVLLAAGVRACLTSPTTQKRWGLTL